MEQLETTANALPVSSSRNSHRYRNNVYSRKGKSSGQTFCSQKETFEKQVGFRPCNTKPLWVRGYRFYRSSNVGATEKRNMECSGSARVKDSVSGLLENALGPFFVFALSLVHLHGTLPCPHVYTLLWAKRLWHKCRNFDFTLRHFWIGGADQLFQKRWDNPSASWKKVSRNFDSVPSLSLITTGRWQCTSALGLLDIHPPPAFQSEAFGTARTSFLQNEILKKKHTHSSNIRSFSHPPFAAASNSTVTFPNDVASTSARTKANLKPERADAAEHCHSANEFCGAKFRELVGRFTANDQKPGQDC